GAPALGGGLDQALRPRGGGRGAQAGVGPGATADAPPHRAAPLLADPGHRRGRAARALPVPRLEPARGAADPAPGDCGLPRQRPPRPAGGTHPERRPGVQRRDPAAPARVPRPPAVPPPDPAALVRTAIGEAGSLLIPSPPSRGRGSGEGESAPPGTLTPTLSPEGAGAERG